MHYTAGASAESSVNWLINPDAKASAHLVIDRDGSIVQLVDFNRKAWHAGKSQWRGISGLNNHSIGIELDNPGILQGSPGSWRTSWGRPVPDTEVLVKARSSDNALVGWHTYTEVQLEVAREASLALVRHYNLEEMVGHEDIAPGRKKDPGAAFPMSSFQSLMAGRDSDDAEDVFETTTDLGCSISHRKAAKCSRTFHVGSQGSPTACEHGGPEVRVDPPLDINGAHRCHRLADDRGG